MSSKKRRKFTREFKSRVALNALREQFTLAELASKYNLHPNQISAWKKQAKESLPEVFGTVKRDDENERLVSSLYEEIGRLKVQLDWLKKKSDSFR